MTQGDLFPPRGDPDHASRENAPENGSERLQIRVCEGPECGREFSVNPRASLNHRFCSDPCRCRWHKAQEMRPMTRAERILERLRHGPATGLDLLRAGGGTRYGARIKELRNIGHMILGPVPWTRFGDAYTETRVTERTPEGHDVYRLED